MKHITQLENRNYLKSYFNSKIFIKNELIKTKELFNNVNGYSLDRKQRLSIISKEDSILLLAGAGSGKTLTIIGKIRYLIEILKIRSEDILCISFTNDSVNNLKKILYNRYDYDIDVFTFHKFAFNIIRQYNKNVMVAPDDELDYIITEYFYSNMPKLNILKKENNYIFIQFKKLIMSFINIYKSNNYEYLLFDKILSRIDYGIDYIFVKIIKDIYNIYTIELKSKNMIDFNDMINEASYAIEHRKNIKKYKYIIIDEYQDTSNSKYEMIKKFKMKTKSKLFCVGDDFQSIYGFTGCNLELFLNFKKCFKNSKIMKIENTYRNSSELIKISTNFIIKNKKQIPKKLKSNKKLYKPIKIIYYKNIKQSFEKLILEIYSKKNKKIMVLSRNNNDIYKVLNKNFKLEKNNIIYIKNKDIKITYLTVHKSKGLEEENVIIINLEDKIDGFPNKVNYNDILKYIKKNNTYYPYEEERRLFYVALTRTKNYVYLFVNPNKQSIFVKELINDNKNLEINYNY